MGEELEYGALSSPDKHEQSHSRTERIIEVMEILKMNQSMLNVQRMLMKMTGLKFCMLRK